MASHSNITATATAAFLLHHSIGKTDSGEKEEEAIWRQEASRNRLSPDAVY